MLSTKNAGALIDGAPASKQEAKMVSIELTRNTVVGGKACNIGDIVKATQAEARFLIAIKKALPVADKAPEVENREADIKTSKRKSTGRNRRIKPDGN